MDDTTQRPRPLSPHLQVYRPQLNTITSILHRITGYALAVGTLMVVWLLAAAASGPGAYDFFMTFAGSPVGQLLWFGWSVALFYHLCNGIRHLIWDTGRLFDLKHAAAAGYVVLIATALLTALVWCPVFFG
ncbi:MAG: succinate dehydrogenase, cytochrome b556 subunit [Alphaproteobacteria bacterium]|nr:succinate dehydrogenase, cytochrome b556 subunit [Alphaproteobacteria bacterium]